jgi:hypothetical protein
MDFVVAANLCPGPAEQRRNDSVEQRKGEAMGGLIGISLILGWLLLAAKIATLLTRRWSNARALNALHAFVVFALLVPLPILDEVVGALQFKS